MVSASQALRDCLGAAIMTTGKLCIALVTTLLVSVAGCGDVRSGAESQTSQALTGCELDCPSGQVFTCSQPCSVTATTLNCNGVVTSCPQPAGVCGNGLVETGEVCDDGNNNSFDQCSPDCLHACTGSSVWCDCTLEHCTTPAMCTRECRE
jgi:cysteine-rich repeat protein